MTPHRWATLVVALAAILLVFALVGCASGGSSDPRVDDIVAEYERLDVTDDEADDMRQMIEDALDALPASEHDEYLDTLLGSTKGSADAIEDAEAGD